MPSLDKLEKVRLHVFQIPIAHMRSSLDWKLDLSGERLRDNDLIITCAMLGETTSMPELQFLNISENSFGDLGLQALGGIMANGALLTLTKLGMRKGKAPEAEGVEALAGASKKPTGYTEHGMEAFA